MNTTGNLATFTRIGSVPTVEKGRTSPMWKLINTNVKAARFMLNGVLLAGLLYALVATLPAQVDF